MHVNFPEIDETFIKTQVQSGFYINETELVRDAVRRLREENEKKLRFYNAVKLGDDEIKRGETVTYSKQLLDELSNRAIHRALNGEKPNSDVTP